MKKTIFIIILFCSAFSEGIIAINAESPEIISSPALINRIQNGDIEVIIPSILFTFTKTEIKLKFKNPDHPKLISFDNKINFIINGEDVPLEFLNGEAVFLHQFNKSKTIDLYADDFKFNKDVEAFPAWLFASPLLILPIWLFKKNKKSTIVGDNSGKKPLFRKRKNVQSKNDNPIPVKRKIYFREKYKTLFFRK